MDADPKPRDTDPDNWLVQQLFVTLKTKIPITLLAIIFCDFI